MISVNELRRNFGPIVAVNGVSFNVEKGEVLGLSVLMGQARVR